MTWEFYNYIKPVKTLIVKNKFTSHLERMPDAIIVSRRLQLRECLKDLDIIVTIETPYNPDLFKVAKEMGVKSVMIPMYEFFNDKWDKPDLYICPSWQEYNITQGYKFLLPWPVNDKVLKRRKPNKAKVFLYNKGYGGVKNRNSYDEFMKATRLVKSDVKFIINSQGKNNRENYWEMWDQGDVFVFPHKFAGLSLPIQEAMATGLPVITTDFNPFNQIINKDLLIKPYKITQEVISRKLDFYHTSPQDIADKIDEVAGWPSKRIGELSDEAYEYAQSITWRKLLPQYLEFFEKLIK